MSVSDGERRGKPRRRRWALLAAPVLLLVLVAGVLGLPAVQVRYYLWRLEGAYRSLPSSAPVASPQFTVVIHYQQKLRALGPRVAGPLLARRHRHDYLWYWITTSVVGFLRAPEAEEPLLADLRSEDPAVVRQALRVLGALPRLHRPEAVLECLSHPSVEVRAAAVRLVNAHRIREAYPVLVEVLRSDPRALIRALAVQPVARLGGPKAVPLLIEALDDPGVTRTSPRVTVRSAASFWLSALTGKTFPDKAQWAKWWRENRNQPLQAAGTPPPHAIPQALQTTCPADRQSLP